MIEAAIIAGTGIYDIPGFTFTPTRVETEYGPALVNIGEKDGQKFAFLARHGLQHTTPPHQINFRANIRALKDLGVKRILATFAVGSLNRNVPPEGVAVVTDFLDFTHGRAFTFFDGGPAGCVHTGMDEAYCPALNARLLALAPEYGLENVYPNAVYVATNGPRFETPAEVRMYAQLGGDIVGMTGVPEVVLAHELGIHYAALAYSMNWATGIEKKVVLVGGNLPAVKQKMVTLLVRVMQEPVVFDCGCESARL